MKRIILLLLIALSLYGCTQTKPIPPNQVFSSDTSNDNVYRWHDGEKNVTCWIYHAGYQGGISCIPDSQLQP